MAAKHFITAEIELIKIMLLQHKMRLYSLEATCIVSVLWWYQCLSVLTTQQVRGQVSRKGPYEQPVALRRHLAVVVTIQALIDYARPRPAAGWDSASGAGRPSPSVPDSGTLWTIGVPKPRNPVPAVGVSRW